MASLNYSGHFFCWPIYLSNTCFNPSTWPYTLRPRGVLVWCTVITAARLDLWVDPGEKANVPTNGVQVGTTKVGDTKAFPVVLLSVNGIPRFGHVAFLLHQGGTRCYQKMQGGRQPNYCSLHHTWSPPRCCSVTCTGAFSSSVTQVLFSG